MGTKATIFTVSGELCEDIHIYKEWADDKCYMEITAEGISVRIKISESFASKFGEVPQPED